MCTLERLTIHFSFTGGGEGSQNLSPVVLRRGPAARRELCWDMKSPCCLVAGKLETSLTLMDLLSQCQGVLLHPLLVLTNYQACLTGEGCFNLVLWGLSLEDLRSTALCVFSANFQGGLILCGAAGASPPPVSGWCSFLITREIVDWMFGVWGLWGIILFCT